MKLSEIKVDVERIEQGAWIDQIPEMGPLRLKVRGLENSDYRAMTAKLMAAIPRANRVSPDLVRKESERITTQCLIATVLMDWDGLEGDDNAPLPYSKEMATTILTDPAYRGFRNAVVYAADKVSEMVKADTGIDAGN